MGFIVLLLALGAFFLVAELIFLPGVILGATLSLASYGGAVYMAFARYGIVGGGCCVVESKDVAAFCPER